MGIFDTTGPAGGTGIFSGAATGRTSVFEPSRRRRAAPPNLGRTEAELREQALASGLDPTEATREGPGPVERVADILSRGMYSSSGFVEAMATGEENPFGRAFREFFSGAFGLRGDKRTYTEVFDELGVPQGPKLFGTSGPGIAADIFLDPTTYLTFGAGTAVRAYVGASAKVSKAVSLSKKGKRVLAELEQDFRPRAFGYVKQLADVVEDPKLAREMSKREILARQALVKLETDETARQMARSQIVRMAATDATLRDPGGIKYFGRTIVPGDVVAQPLRRFGTRFAERLERGGALERGSLHIAREVSGFFDKVFNESVAQVRKLPGISLLKAAMRDRMHNGMREFNRATLGKDGVLTGAKKVPIRNTDGLPVGRLFREGMPLNEYLALHLDDPGRYPIELIPEAWRRAVHEVRSLLDTWFEAEAAAKLIEPGIWRENYFPHLFDNTPEELRKLSEMVPGQPRGTVGGPFRFGPWDESRTFRTYEEAMATVDALKESGALPASFTLKPTLAVDQVLSVRAIGHHTGLAAREYMERIKQQFAKSNGQFNAEWLEQLLPDIRRAFSGPLREVLDSGQAARALAEAANVQELRRLRALRPRWMTREVEEFLRGKPQTLVTQSVRNALQLEPGKPLSAIEQRRFARELRKATQYLAISGRVFADATQAQKEALREIVEDTGAMRLGAPRGVRLTDYQRIADAGPEELADIAREILTPGAEENVVEAFAGKLAQFRARLPEGGITRKEARWLAGRLQKDFFVHPRTGKAVGRKNTLTVLRQMRMPVQAVFLQARLARLNGMEELLRFVEDFRPIIHGMDPTLYNLTKRLTSKAKSALKHMDGDRMVFKGTKGAPTVLQRAPGGATKSVSEMLGGWWLPESLANDVKNMQERVLNLAQVRGLLNTFDVIGDVFKAGVTVPFPAFHFRNHYSNVAQNFVSFGLNALNPARYVQVARIMAGQDGTVTTPLRRYTYDEVRQLANEMGILKDFEQIAELRSSPRAWVRRHVLNAPLLKPVAGAGAAVENSSRLLAFVKHLEDGLGPEEAAARVKEFLFDYEALSVHERDILGRIFPFYKWTRKNIELTARQMLKNPGRYATFFKTTAAGNRGPEHSTMPYYLRGDLKVRLREGGKGEKALYLMGIDLPVNSAIDTIFTGDMVETLRQKAGMVAPALKLLIEVPTQTDLFTGRSLQERQQLGVLGEWAASAPAWVQDFLEFKQTVGPTGEPEYSMNGLKAYLLMRSWAQARLLTTADRVLKDPDTSYQRMLLDLTLGFRTREMDLAQEQEKKLRRNIRLLQKRLVQRGVLRERPVYFEPQAVP